MKNFFNYVLISISTLIVGFTAMALPFKLFDELSRTEMRILLFAEIVIYFSIVSIYFLIKEKKEESIKKEKRFKELHNDRVTKRQQELQGLKISNYDYAA